MENTIKHFSLKASEFDWAISNEKTVKAWGFNQSLPGPVLRARKGDTLNITVLNDLSEPTIIHWHGIRLPASMDGTGEVQTPIMPGEQFVYKFAVPDSGTFWYHSHHDETVQMERGMYGALIVQDDNDPIVDDDKVFMIDDMKLNRDNSFKNGNVITRWIERHDGREGNTLLINGKEKPTIHLNGGQVERWRFINSSSARYVRLYFGGKSFRVIGVDGGLIEVPQEVTEVLLVPGERVDVAVGPFLEGESFDIESLPYNRVTFLQPKREKFATVQVGAQITSAANLPAELRSINPIAPRDASVTRRIKLSVAPSLKNIIDFKVNDAMHETDKPVYVGDLQVWEVSNTSLMDHPFHLHGFFFQVLEINGKEPAYRAWKDTINLPPRSKAKIAWMPDDRPGMWMYHCHILEHHAAGMMANFEVVDKAKGPILTISKTHACSHR